MIAYEFSLGSICQWESCGFPRVGGALKSSATFMVFGDCFFSVAEELENFLKRTFAKVA